MTFFNYWPYFATLYVMIAAWLGWVNTADDHGDPRQIRFTWVLSALWFVTLPAGAVLYLVGLAQSRRRRQQFEPADPDAGIATWKLAVGYVTVCASIAALCVLIIT